jgi:hypothetical protein
MVVSVEGSTNVDGRRKSGGAAGNRFDDPGRFLGHQSSVTPPSRKRSASRGKQDMQIKVMVALFGLFAEVGRDLISERTEEGLASARAKGRLLGGPRGSRGRSKLDGEEQEIRMLLK